VSARCPFVALAIVCLVSFGCGREDGDSKSMNGVWPPPDVPHDPPHMPLLPPESLLPDRTTTLWSPYLQWDLANSDFDGNPFDLKARVKFVHTETGITHDTGMFFAGNQTWSFRFTGTRIGEWVYSTHSDDPELDGHHGRITVLTNPDSPAHGFLGHIGRQFVRQYGNEGHSRALLYNVFQGGFKTNPHAFYQIKDPETYLHENIARYLSHHGFNVLYSGVIANRWLRMEARSSDEHTSRIPDLRTFESLEELIRIVHRAGYHLHIWAWGDEKRRQTPIGLGGINQAIDRRIQRYIAARLGPLPGWSMGYGFDLNEWVTETELESWAQFLHQEMGWPHLLFARGYRTPSLDGVAYASHRDLPGIPALTSPSGPISFEEVVTHFDSSLERPHLFSERFFIGRDLNGLVWNQERTLDLLWWCAMAGGFGSWWGLEDDKVYPDPVSHQTYAEFWRDRFLIGMERVDGISNALVLAMPERDRWIVYLEDDDIIRLDLSEAPGGLAVVAVDARKPYRELDLGILEPEAQTWSAPYRSHWALAIGAFPDRESRLSASPNR